VTKNSVINEQNEKATNYQENEKSKLRNLFSFRDSFVPSTSSGSVAIVPIRANTEPVI